MTASPRLPGGAAGHAAGPESPATGAELNRMAELARCRDARTIAIGHGRSALAVAAADPDLWVMTGPAGGWAQMTRRLLWSTPWRPGRTIAFAGLGTPSAIGLVGALP